MTDARSSYEAPRSSLLSAPRFNNEIWSNAALTLLKREKRSVPGKLELLIRPFAARMLYKNPI